MYRRLLRAPEKPGPRGQRRWLRKGKAKGYVSVPFAAAVRAPMAQPDIDVCLVGRREASDATSQAWGRVIDEVPAFDIVGEVRAPADLDPLDPAWDVPLDKPVPSDEELRALVRDPAVERSMREMFGRGAEELSSRASGGQGPEVLRRVASVLRQEASVLRRVAEGLPAELRGDRFRGLVRSSVSEILKLLWSVHFSSGATRMRWRFACTDDDSDLPSSPDLLRAYFILAGEELDFVPSRFVDANGLRATQRLSEEQTRRMSSEDWVSSVTARGTNVSEALKRVPPGLTTFLKGERYPGMKGSGAVFRLPRTGRRVQIEVEVLEQELAGVPSLGGASAGAAGDERLDDGYVAALVAGLTAGLLALIRNTPPFQSGSRLRSQIDALLRRPARTGGLDAEAMSRFEQRLRRDFRSTVNAPVVLVVGSQCETGRVIARRLSSGGFHVRRLAPAAVPSAGRRGAGEAVCPADLYEGVAGVDKVVVVVCSDEGAAGRLGEAPAAQQVKDVLACWQLYLADFSEGQIACSAKVRLFSFGRRTDFELWDLERRRNSDVCYGDHSARWVRDPSVCARLVGHFREPLGQVQLRSPVLKLDLRRFSGLVLRLRGRAPGCRFSFFLRTAGFEESRVQYEADLRCGAAGWHVVRLPFNAFRPVRADGVELPENEAASRPLDRSGIVQLGLSVRTGPGRPSPGAGGAEGAGRFSVAVRHLAAFREQKEPQVVCVGSGDAPSPPVQDEAEDDLFLDGDPGESEPPRDRGEAAGDAGQPGLDQALVELRGGPASAQAEEEIAEPYSSSAGTAMQAVVESGLAYTLIKVTGVNEHPGGKYPVGVVQDSTRGLPLSSAGRHRDGLRTISRGDAAELVASALVEPSCVNAEISAGEVRQQGVNAEGPAEASEAEAFFQVTSTMQEDVKAYLKKLTPNV